MSDTNTKNYLKDLAKATDKPCAQWFLFVALDKVIKDRNYPEAFLSKEKRKAKVRKLLVSLVEEYTNKLEPLGGSWLGSADPMALPTSNASRTTTWRTSPIVILRTSTT